MKAPELFAPFVPALLQVDVERIHYHESAPVLPSPPWKTGLTRRTTRKPAGHDFLPRHFPDVSLSPQTLRSDVTTIGQSHYQLGVARTLHLRTTAFTDNWRHCDRTLYEALRSCVDEFGHARTEYLTMFEGDCQYPWRTLRC
jgi:hypothetical protein